MNRAGTLDTRIAIQRKSSMLSSSGEPIDVWTTIGLRWADVKPLVGSEVSVSAQWVAREQVRFTIRWDTILASLSPLDRVVMPASEISNSPLDERSLYDVMFVQEPKRNDTLEITASRQAAVSHVQETIFATEGGDQLMTEDGDYLGDTTIVLGS